EAWQPGGQIVDDVMFEKLEMPGLPKSVDVFDTPRMQIVETENVIAVSEQLLAKVGAEKARTSGDTSGLSRSYPGACAPRLRQFSCFCTHGYFLPGVSLTCRTDEGAAWGS